MCNLDFSKSSYYQIHKQFKGINWMNFQLTDFEDQIKFLNMRYHGHNSMVTLVSKFICRENLKARSTLMYSKFADKENKDIMVNVFFLQFSSLGLFRTSTRYSCIIHTIQTHGWRIYYFAFIKSYIFDAFLIFLDCVLLAAKAGETCSDTCCYGRKYSKVEVTGELCLGAVKYF